MIKKRSFFGTKKNLQVLINRFDEIVLRTCIKEPKYINLSYSDIEIYIEICIELNISELQAFNNLLNISDLIKFLDEYYIRYIYSDTDIDIDTSDKDLFLIKLKNNIVIKDNINNLGICRKNFFTNMSYDADIEDVNSKTLTQYIEEIYIDSIKNELVDEDINDIFIKYLESSSDEFLLGASAIGFNRNVQYQSFLCKCIRMIDGFQNYSLPYWVDETVGFLR